MSGTTMPIDAPPLGWHVPGAYMGGRIDSLPGAEPGLSAQTMGIAEVSWISYGLLLHTLSA
jgi:hypothetical protein